MRKPATLAEASQVIGQTKELMPERAALIGDGGAEDETGVVEREVSLRLGKELTVEICERCHLYAFFR